MGEASEGLMKLRPVTFGYKDDPAATSEMLGRLDDIGSLEVGKCADFFSIDRTRVYFAGVLHDPVAAVVFCSLQKARHTVINGKVVVEDGRVATVDMGPMVEQHNRFAFKLAAGK